MSSIPHYSPWPVGTNASAHVPNTETPCISKECVWGGKCRVIEPLLSAEPVK